MERMEWDRILLLLFIDEYHAAWGPCGLISPWGDRIAKRVYVGECAGDRSVGRPRKRWIDTVKECLRKNRFGCQASKENCPE